MARKRLARFLVEGLEPRVMLSLDTPQVLFVNIGWGEVAGQLSKAHFQWHDNDPTNTTYVAQWSESNTFNTYQSLTWASIGNNDFEATQNLDAGQKYWYRVKAVVGGSESAWTTPVSPYVPRDEAVEAQASATGSGIQLSWTDPVTLPSSTSYVRYNVYRKTYGATSWQGPLNGTELNTTDYTDSVSSGSAYEYQVERKHYNSSNSLTQTQWGYIYAGRNKSLVEARGTVLLVVDSSLSSTSEHSADDVALLSSDIVRFKQDLIGDGWTVKQISVGRDASNPNDATQAATLKRNPSNLSDAQTINGVFNTTPGGLQSIILIGHVPVPYSGYNVVPDGHGNHIGAWPTDAYYGVGLGTSSPDSGWTLNSNFTNQSRPQNNNSSSDGKFDNSFMPSNMAVPVGRIDFANMSEMKYSFPQVSQNVWPSPASAEMLMYHRYFDKDHRWRIGQLEVQPRALIDDQWGQSVLGFIRPSFAWRNFSALVGRDNVFAKDWESELHDESYLWAYGGGGGHDDGADGVTSLYYYYHDPATGATVANVQYNAAFVVLAGSYFGDFDHNEGGSGYYANLMRATLGMEGASLVVSWGVKSNWMYQPMALGETAGASMLLTQNNAGTSSTVTYKPYSGEERAIWQNLLGDPTIRMSYVKPVMQVNMTIDRDAGTVTVDWNDSDDHNASGFLGYEVYRADALGDGSGFTLVSGSTPITSTSFTEDQPMSGRFVYMVRAVKTESTPSGTYQNASTGAFAVDVTVVGAADADTMYLKRETNLAQGIDQYDLWCNETDPGIENPTFSLDARIVNSITLQGGTDNDLFPIDFSGGSPVPSGGLHVEGGDDTDIVFPLGADEYDDAEFSTDSFTVNDSVAVTYDSDVERVWFTGNYDSSQTTDIDDVNVIGGKPVTLWKERLNSLAIANGATAQVAAGTGITLVTKSLQLNTSGTLDLYDNDMIVKANVQNTLEGKVYSARNGGAWNGTGLTSTAAAQDSNHDTTLAVVSGAEYTSFGHTSFNGYSYASTDVIVKYTYYGDAQLSGSVTFDDYVRIDTGFNNGRTGWSNGDFNYSGSVNFDDYVLIDTAYNSQGSPL